TRRNQAGSQRVCSSSGIVYYPKMSPVVIALVSDGKRCLLGRQSSFPRGMYSALAGFCDMGQAYLLITSAHLVSCLHTCLTYLSLLVVPGESLEEALCREVAEEVGLEVQSVSYSSSQHWPFPHSSFMLGCHATVSPAHTQVSSNTRSNKL
uniref:Nudix hydrolase domain-containing protein n=1 Tax=Monopterus albus TaxID=43700 RepID=A0A3Q3JCG3_MONAL